VAFSPAAVSLRFIRTMAWLARRRSYRSSRIYGADENDVFNATFIEGLAETHIACRWVDARSAPVNPQDTLKNPILRNEARQVTVLRILNEICSLNGRHRRWFAY